MSISNYRQRSRRAFTLVAGVVVDAELGSISRWICDLKDGDLKAAQPLWDRYFDRLVRIARRKLEGSPRRVADEEDVALSAFASFCRAVEEGRFPNLLDRDDLWRILFAITVRKAIDQRRFDARLVRGGANTIGETEADGPSGWFRELLASEPTPEFAVITGEECGRLLGLLDDNLLKDVAVAKLEGYTNREIAGRLEWSLSTIERCLRLIRKTWEREIV